MLTLELCQLIPDLWQYIFSFLGRHEYPSVRDLEFLDPQFIYTIERWRAYNRCMRLIPRKKMINYPVQYSYHKPHMVTSSECLAFRYLVRLFKNYLVITEYTNIKASTCGYGPIDPQLYLEGVNSVSNTIEEKQIKKYELFNDY